MSQTKQFYEFEDFRLDLTNKTLVRLSGEPVSITRKMFETLLALVENADRLMEKDELMQRIWHDRFVEESNLTFNIKMLRKALGDDAARPRFIETVPRRGYRFIAVIKESGGQKDDPQPTISAPAQAGVSFKKSYPAAALLMVLLSTVGLTAWIWKSNSSRADAPLLTAEFDSVKLSDTGKVYHAVISPNGQYVVYSNKVGGKESLWLRHLETANNTQIIPPSDDNYFGLAFSHGGETVFFTRKRSGYAQPISIYRTPLTGGVPTKITDGSQGWISLSPDDKQLAFVRYDAGVGDFNRLMLIDADGGGREREIKLSEAPNAYWANAFSPDGASIAAVYGHSRNASQAMGLVEIDLSTGTQRELAAARFFHIKDLVWLPNKSGLLFSANETINDKSRLWKLDYETQTVSPVSKDSADYSGLSLTSNADKMVAVTYSADFHLYLQSGDGKNFNSLTQARDNFAFTPDGKIVYATDAAGNEDLWIMDADGSHQRQLTTDKSLDFTPLASPDNRHIFYTSNRTGESQIWRIDTDGSNQTQITFKEGGYARFISPDGRWLYYQSAFSNKLWKIATDGGAEFLFEENYGYYQAFSPDGKRLAYLFREKETNKIKIKVLSTENREVLKIFDTPTETTSYIHNLCWRSNTTLAFSIEEKNARDSLWEQDLSKAEPVLRHDLGSEEIKNIQYSPDGEKFAFIRGSWRHDAFLIKGLK